MLAALLALGSSLAWGGSDFLGGLKSRSSGLLAVLLISQATALVLLTVAVMWLGEGPPDARFLVHAVLAGVAESVAVAALYRGLAVGAMSVVAPLAAAAPVVPLVVGVVGGEVPAVVQAIGLVVAMIGVVLVSGPGQPSGQRSARRASVAYGLLAALGFGAFFVSMDAASEGGVPWALLGTRITTVAIVAAAGVVALVMRSRMRPQVRRADVPVIAAIGVLVLAGDAMYAMGSTVGLLGVVAVLSALHPVVTITLARIYLDERIARVQLFGITATVVGVVAITV